mgnify:CR=1 FL=1
MVFFRKTGTEISLTNCVGQVESMHIVSETSKRKQTCQELGSYETISLQIFAVMSISALIFEKSQAFPVGSSKLNWIQKLRELFCKK